MTAIHHSKIETPLILHAATAKDVMSANPWSVREDAAVHEAVVFLTDRRISAAPVINEASGGKQYSPSSSGWATRQLNGSSSMPWQVTSRLRSDSNRCISA